MNALEQLEADEREAWKAWDEYNKAGKELRDKWHALYLKVAREKLKSEIMAEELSKTETK